MYITVDFSISARIAPMGVPLKQFLASSTQISCNLLKKLALKLFSTSSKGFSLLLSSFSPKSLVISIKTLLIIVASWFSFEARLSFSLFSLWNVYFNLILYCWHIVWLFSRTFCYPINLLCLNPRNNCLWFCGVGFLPKYHRFFFCYQYFLVLIYALWLFLVFWSWKGCCSILGIFMTLRSILMKVMEEQR